MRNSKSKSNLKKLTRVDISARHVAQEATCTAIDGCALLWIPQWPFTSTQQTLVMDFVNKFKNQIKESGDVYLVFNRYKSYSTKSSTRISRMTEGCKVFQLYLAAPLPTQKVTLTITENKKQLIDIICNDLQRDTDFHWKNTEKHKLVITGREKTPVEISSGGVVIQRHDIVTTHEEADNIIVQQAILVAIDEQKHVTILADDTDVYALQLHHYLQQGLQIPMVMDSPINERTVIDIQATVEKIRAVIPSLLACHTLSGCDTVAACFGVGKGKMLKVLRKRVSVDMIGNIQADWSKVMEQATKFTAECYGQPKATSMSEARVSVWTAQIGKPGLTRVPKLASLPPTTIAFAENVKRAHLQTFIWKNALQLDPQSLEPTD